MLPKSVVSVDPKLLKIPTSTTLSMLAMMPYSKAVIPASFFKKVMIFVRTPRT